MNVARDGIPFILAAAVVAAAGFALAVARRSWPLWLISFGLTLVAVWLPYCFRDQGRTHVLGAQVAGLAARQNMNHAAEGDSARQGERMKRIRSGSRGDDVVPPRSTRRVRVGDRPAANVAVRAEVPS